MLLDRVEVKSVNEWFNVDGVPTYDNIYYNAGLFANRDEQWTSDTRDILCRYNFYVSNLQKTHSRTVYGFIDLLGDLGGVLEVIMVVMGAILYPIAEHHYTLQAAKRIFMARTSDPKLFKNTVKGNLNLETNDKILRYTDQKIIE